MNLTDSPQLNVDNNAPPNVDGNAKVRVRKLKMADGTIKEYKYETIKGIPVAEYYKSKQKNYYVPKPRTPKPKDAKLEQLIIDLHERKAEKKKIAEVLNISVYNVRKTISEHEKAQRAALGIVIVPGRTPSMLAALEATEREKKNDEEEDESQ